jgi:GNAT superfamily N-acetyltransferase
MITIEEIGLERADQIIDLVAKLLDEISEGSAELDRQKIIQDWTGNQDTFTAFVALDDSKTILGVITLVDSFAVYAGGRYGVINELYVLPEHRNQQVGRMLVETAKDYGRYQGWKRINVTAPLGEKWERTIKFYEREGFAHTGPKLKFKY